MFRPLACAGLTIGLAAAGLWIGGCGEKLQQPDPTNPFDPGNPETSGDPLNVRVSLTNDSTVTVQWDAIYEIPVAGYRVHRSTDSLLDYTLVGSTLSGTTSLDDTTIGASVFYYYKATAYRDAHESELDACRPAGPVWTHWGCWDDGGPEVSCGLYSESGGSGGWAVTFRSAARVSVTKVKISLVQDSPGDSVELAGSLELRVWNAGWGYVYSSDPIVPDSVGWSGWLEHEVGTSPDVGPGTFAVGVWLPTTSESHPDWYFHLDSDFSGSEPPGDEFNDESWVNDGEGWHRLSEVLCNAELMFWCYVEPPDGTSAKDEPGPQSAASLHRARGRWLGSGGAKSPSDHGPHDRPRGRRARLVLSERTS